jgi:hypothetical protein
MIVEDDYVCSWVACVPSPLHPRFAVWFEGEGFNIVFQAARPENIFQGATPCSVTFNRGSPVFYAEAETASGETLPQRIELAGGTVVVTVEEDDGRPLPNDTDTYPDNSGYLYCGCPGPSNSYPWIDIDSSCVGGDGVVCYDMMRPSIPDIELDLKVEGVSARVDAVVSRRYSLRRGGVNGTLFLSESYYDTPDRASGWSSVFQFLLSTGEPPAYGGYADGSIYISIAAVAGKPWESVYIPEYFGYGNPGWLRDKSAPTVCGGLQNRYMIQVELYMYGSVYSRGPGFFTMAEFFTDQCFDRLCNGVRPFRVERNHVHHWPPEDYLPLPGGLIIPPGPTIKLTVERP